MILIILKRVIKAFISGQTIIFESNYNIEFKDCVYFKKKCCYEHLHHPKNSNIIKIIVQEGEVKLNKEDFSLVNSLEPITLLKSLIQIEKLHLFI